MMNTELMKEEVEAIFNTAAEKACEVIDKFTAAEEYVEGLASFPIEYNYGEYPDDGEAGEPIDDPMVLRVIDPEHDYGEPSAKYEINLRDVVRNLADSFTNIETDLIDNEEFTPIIIKIRDGFLELAATLTDALGENDKVEG